MNLNVVQLMNQNYNGFLKLVELEIIDKKRACEAVIKSNNPNYIYYFACGVKDANLEELEDAIIQTMDAEYIYKFVKHIKGSNFEKLQDAIIQIGSAEYIHNFARYVEGANIEKLENAIIQTQNNKFTFLFHKNVNIIKNIKMIIEKNNRNSKENIGLINLMELLNKERYEDIFANRENFAQLFADDTTLNEEDKEVEKILKMK